jgi:hypothetical protein
MAVPHGTRTVHRFSAELGHTVYGPRQLEWVGGAYAARDECECAPADAAATPPAAGRTHNEAPREFDR